MRMQSLAIRVASIGMIVAAWWVVTDALPLFSPIILPSPGDVVKSAYSLARDGGLTSGGLYEANLLGHILISLRRVLIAWACAVAVALPLGFALGAWPDVSRYVDLTVRIASQVPPIAFIPLAIVWFGLGEAPILFIIFIGALWAMLTSVESGVRSVPQLLVRAARSQGASDAPVFTRVILPAALPYVFTGMRVSFGVAWVAIVAAELVASSSGLGYLIEHARRILASSDIVVGMICIGMLGVTFDALFRALENRLCRWK